MALLLGNWLDVVANVALRVLLKVFSGHTSRVFPTPFARGSYSLLSLQIHTLDLRRPL